MKGEKPAALLLLEQSWYRFLEFANARRFPLLLFLLLGIIPLATFTLWRALTSPHIRQETRTVNLFQHYPDDFHQHFAIIIHPSPSPTGTAKLDSIEINWPKEMEISSSGYVILRVKERPYLTYVTQQTPAPTISPEATVTPSPTPSISREGHVSNLASAIPVPTPWLNLWWRTEDIYGVAKLSATNFNISPGTPDAQKLENGIAEWRWNISPKEAGNQILNASLEVQFVAKLKDPSGIEHVEGPRSGGVVWLEDLPIKTYKPWFTKESLTIGSIIAGVGALLGALGISIPWLLERLRRRSEGKSKHDRIGFIK